MIKCKFGDAMSYLLSCEGSKAYYIDCYSHKRDNWWISSGHNKIMKTYDDGKSFIDYVIERHHICGNWEVELLGEGCPLYCRGECTSAFAFIDGFGYVDCDFAVACNLKHEGDRADIEKCKILKLKQDRIIDPYGHYMNMDVKYCEESLRDD